MLDPRALTHAQLAAIVAEVQRILWQESHIMPDFPREMGEYWNPAKKADDSDLEEIAEVLDAANSGTVRISFQHRYGKLPLDRQDALQTIAGADFERFFKKSVSLKVKKEISEDPVRLEQMVITLAQTMGPENFAMVFEVEQSWSPTKVFTETSCQLPHEARAALQAAGLKQVIAMAAK